MNANFSLWMDVYEVGAKKTNIKSSDIENISLIFAKILSLKKRKYIILIILNGLLFE